ncbi:acetyl-CoA C-acyltransferase [Rhodococcus sp. ACPA4]|uniref:Acetyl-CoA acetyltransferase family protein n=1 Tax=Nocardia globerula TaxID=1818 RepID=A0A652YHJ1_NOCGL|nr:MULTISPECIES: thiolase family protein [Rhodococcus]NMD64303.1 thiolase family protein [Nocardia globerula]MCE4265791.1 thiolase family protein [Rhodococcus globerulus]NRI70005.1 thiolase family protein [Rhodococcus sp. MS16]PBC42944.1 acetyl-CoA C-acyltransferase [Rhodococcus sp. ACPA4]PVX63380.1 acetyl-CoA acetyltransferase family protein [Rhodococcus globerulus]
MTAVIVEAVRTPVGRRNGGLSSVHPADLSAVVLNALVERAGIDPSIVEDVIWGCVQQVGDQANDVARNAVLAAGWPESVPGVTVDRQCGSSQQALNFAVASVAAGHYDVVVAGGVESMSRVPMGSAGTFEGSPYSPAYMERYNGVKPNQGVGAEAIAEKWGLTRNDLDTFAVQSHERAAAAQDAGLFDHQIVSVTTPDGTVVSRDEGIRRGSSVESLGKLKTVFKEDGVIHAGNASQISDGASALLIMSEEAAARYGVTPIAKIHSVAVVGDDPIIMLTAPIPATKKVLEKAGLTVDDIGVFEVNEAFASVPLAWLAEVGADPARVNPNGGAIALGHPLGGSGGRILTDMLHHMLRNNIQYGLQTMCEGGGQANATILELVNAR